MKFHFENCVETPIESVFALHEDPGNLAVMVRKMPTFRMIYHAGNIRLGSVIWFEFRLAHIVPVVMGFEHTIYEPPLRFGEELIHGPFSCFVHIHEFEERTNGTIVRDILEVRLPWHYGGEVAMRILVAPVLRRAFAIRAQALSNLAESGILAAYPTRSVL